jgi:hypothetical protein
MSSLKNQTVYVVTEYDRDGIVQGFNLYAEAVDALKARNKINAKVKSYGGFAETDRTVIN